VLGRFCVWLCSRDYVVLAVVICCLPRARSVCLGELRVVPVASSVWAGVSFKPRPSRTLGGWGPGEFCSQHRVCLGEICFSSSTAVCLCAGPCSCCSRLSAPGSESVSPDSNTLLGGTVEESVPAPGPAADSTLVRSRGRCCFPSKAA